MGFFTFFSRRGGGPTERPDPQAILSAFEGLLTAPIWADARRFLEQHPELLSDEADALLEQVVQSLEDAPQRQSIEEYRILLRRCHEVGVEAAFAEMTASTAGTASSAEDIPEDVSPLLELLATLPPEDADAFMAILTRVDSPEALIAALNDHPALRTALEQVLAGARQMPPEFHDDLQRADDAEARYLQGDGLRALDEAVAAWERIVQHDNFARATLDFRLMVLDGAGTTLLRRYWARGRWPDLEHALAYFEQAVALTPEDSPALPMYLNNLGAGLSDRYGRTGVLLDLERAIAVSEQACVRGLDVALEAAWVSSRAWGAWALERMAWEEAAHAYAFGLEAIARLLRVQLMRTGKEAWLRELQGFHSRAAYALARTNDIPAAVLALEQSRAVLLTETLERDRAALDTLSNTHPDLFETYRQTAQRVAQLDSREGQLEGLPPGIDLAAVMRTARLEIDAAVEAIRQVPGYDTFLLPPTFATVQAALAPMAERGGLLYLATTPVGSVALLVHTHGNEAIWLPFTETDLQALLVQGDDELTGGYLPGQFGAHDWLVASLAEALPLLGERVMAPVAARLHELKLKQIVLIPTGRLSLLPLHAAGYARSGQMVRFLDEFTVAYAPNARVLGTAQREASRRHQAPSLVGVGNPLPHPKPLNAAQAELEEIAAFFPATAQQPLYTTEATKAALLQWLGDGVYLHFACHGLFDLDTPLASRLELGGQESLTLRDILYGEAQPHRARLVVLSACQSAISDFRHLPEEYVGLPAGFLQAGVPGVVGTLWPVDDISTALVMVKFYELHLRGDAKTDEGPLPPSAALCRAQQWLRDVSNGELTEYFARHYQLHEARRQVLARMSEETVAAGLSRFSLDDPEAQPFANSPYH